MASLEVMERTAIGSSGRVGSLYDGCRDCVLENLKMSIKQVAPVLKESVSCELIKWDAVESHNLLEMIGIESDLRLSILLNPAARKNLAEFIVDPYPFDEYTRFLHYTYVNRIEELDTSTQFPNLPESWDVASSLPTHIITNVTWGINFVVVLQLSPDTETITLIDEKLETIRTLLNGDSIDVIFCLDDEKLFEEKVKTKVYSNMPALRDMTSLFTICQYIAGRGERFNFYRPVKYLLQPIKYIYPQYIGPEVNFSTLPSPSIEKLEQYLISILDNMKKQKYFFDSITKNDLLRKYLKDRLDEVQQEWVNYNNAYKKEMNQILKLISRIRSGNSDISEIDKILENRAQTTLNKCLETFTRNVAELEAKQMFITRLHEQQFEYCNVKVLGIKRKDYQQTLPDKLMTNQKEIRILCSNNSLNEKNQPKLNSLRDQLCQDKKDNPNLHLIFADFSYCSIQLPDIIILPCKKRNSNASIITTCTPPSTEDDVVNILLLGESGVGKSTFINAFINYLTFDTLKMAESKKPVVLMPVSFFITVGDNFEEKIVKFGVSDDFKNEDFDHPGESVTQHCRSYIFTLNSIAGKRLRIIDTPGFGDTRGLDQDDVNMQHILKYINNLTHLNAICFLLKSNTTQLNNYFSICLTQLLDFLGPNAHENIIFCFTNARATFYTPGSAVSLLKTMLQSFSTDDIPFKKENTFCFDNESFRYLVALQNEIQFSHLDRNEYEMSWSTSLKEVHRLINYVTTQLQIYSLDSNRQTIKHAQIEITKMIRPILEGMRNIHRHMIMKNMKILNKSIKLKPKFICRPASRCLSCKPIPIEFGKFLFTEDDPHEMLKSCYQCSCNPSEHCSIDYILYYELSDRLPNYDENPINGMIQQLCQASNIFAYFLLNVARSTKCDPFLTGFMNIIIEETKLCQIQKTCHFNSKLLEDLKKLQSIYEDNMDEMKSNKNVIDLQFIYQWIQKVRVYPEVQEQLAAVEEGQKMLMQEYEYIVPEDLIEN